MSELTDITEPIADAMITSVISPLPVELSTASSVTLKLVTECEWCGSKDPMDWHKCQLTLHKAYGLYPDKS